MDDFIQVICLKSKIFRVVFVLDALVYVPTHTNDCICTLLKIRSHKHMCTYSPGHPYTEEMAAGGFGETD